MKHTELCMLLEHRWFWSTRLFYRRTVCIFQRSSGDFQTCPLCFSSSHACFLNVSLESFSFPLAALCWRCLNSGTGGGWRLTERKSERGWLLTQGLISLSSSQYSTQRDMHCARLRGGRAVTAQLALAKACVNHPEHSWPSFSPCFVWFCFFFLFRFNWITSTHFHFPSTLSYCSSDRTRARFKKMTQD